MFDKLFSYPAQMSQELYMSQWDKAKSPVPLLNSVINRIASL